MYKKIHLTGLLLLACILILTACSKQPKPSSFQFSNQKKVQAAHHWEILANDLTKELSNSAQLNEKLTEPLTIIPNDNSPFTRAFRSFLTTHFVNSGVKLNNSALNLKLDWSLQLVEHKANRTVDQYPGLNTAIFAISYGVYKLWDNTGVAEGLLATGLTLDLAKEVVDLSTIEIPNSEVIVNVSLLDANNNIIYRKSNIYYINDLDKDHYYFTPDLAYKNKPARTKSYIVSD